MRIYIVLEDYFELHECSYERVFHGAYQNEEEASKKAKELESPYGNSSYYYEEIEVL